jgi:hypothetical protein
VNSQNARPAEMAPGALSHAEVAGALSHADVAGTLSHADVAGTVSHAEVAGTPSQAGASAVRGSPGWRQLSFRASGLTIELEITGTGDDRRLTGQLIPRQPAVVDIRHADGVITVEADELGRFSAEAVPPDQVSLRSRLGPATDHSSVVTGWVTI